MSDQQASGSAQQDPAASGADQQSREDKVAYETYRRVLSEKKAMAEKLAQFEQMQRQREEEEAKAKEDWKKMLDIRNQELESLRSEYGNLKGQVFQAVKRNAFEKAVGTRLEPQYERLIDYDSIVIDPNGQVDEMALSKYAEQFKKDYRSILAPVAVPGVSQKAPEGAKEQRTKEDIFRDFAKLL